MSRRSSALASAVAAALALGAALPAAAAPPATPSPPGAVDLPIEGVVTNPDWVAKPSGERFASVYPLVAQALHLSGKVLLSCQVTLTGDLAGCRAAREDPPGEGFGPAALSMAADFKMKPQTVDGQPMGGARVDIPISFSFADGAAAPPASAPTPVIDEPTPAAIELGRRIIAASGRQAALPGQVAGLIADINRLKAQAPANNEEAKAQSAAAEVLEASLEQVRPQFEAARARALARTFTELELRQILAFLESPAGAAWTSRLAKVDELETTDTAALLQSAMATARDRYCALQACAPGSTSRPASSAASSNPTTVAGPNVKASSPTPQTGPQPPARP